MASVDGQRFSDNASGNGDKFKCNPCSNSGLVKEADKFCRECDEYMCASCAGFHKSFNALRNHTVVFCGENSFIDRTVASSANIKVGAAGFISGSTIMPDGRLVLADYGQRRRIILLDRKFTIQSALKLQERPWDVAADGDNDVIASTGSSNPGLQWIHVDGVLRAGRTVTTSGCCYGVAVHSGHIYIIVMMGYPSYRFHIEVLTRDGSVVRRIGMDDGGAETFTHMSTLYITVGASGTMYVADCSIDRITCFSSTGDEVYAVTHNDIRGPRSMVADDDGNLLVCCFDSNNVQVLAKDGSHNRTMLTSADGVAEPLSMAYRQSDRTLIVTTWHKPYCRAYKLK